MYMRDRMINDDFSIGLHYTIKSVLTTWCTSQIFKYRASWEEWAFAQFKDAIAITASHEIKFVNTIYRVAPT